MNIETVDPAQEGNPHEFNETDEENEDEALSDCEDPKNIMLSFVGHSSSSNQAPLADIDWLEGGRRGRKPKPKPKPKKAAVGIEAAMRRRDELNRRLLLSRRSAAQKKSDKEVERLPRS